MKRLIFILLFFVSVNCFSQTLFSTRVATVINTDTGRTATALFTGGMANKVRDSLQANITAAAGANTTLSNLGTTSINSALLAQTGLDIGSTTKPFKDLYLYGSGTYATTYNLITGTPTSTRTHTLQDNSGTIAELNANQTFNNTNTFTGGVFWLGGFGSSSSGSIGNIWGPGAAGTGISGTFSTSTYLFGGASNVQTRVGFGGSTSTVLTANASTGNVIFASQPMTEATSGTHAVLANMVFIPQVITNGSATTTDATNVYISGPPTGITPTNPATSMWVASGISRFDGGLNYNPTITAGGTTGNQTINKVSGTVNIAAAGTTVTVTNSFVTTSSIVFCVIRTNDATATGVKNVVPGSGSFVVTLNAAATAEISIGFFVIN